MPPTRLRTATAPAFRLRVMVVVMLCATWLTGAAARPAAAADGGARWTVETEANSYGADRADYRYTLSPGNRVQDGIVVYNDGTTTLRLALRPAEGVTTAAGRLGLVDRGTRSPGAAAWVHLARDVITVRPGATVAVPFTVTPPKGAAAGDHIGGIITTPVGSAAGAGQRRGLPIRLRISGTLKPGLAVDDVRLHYSGTASPLGAGDATVTYMIRNTGNAILTAKQAVSASGPFGSWSRKAGKIADSPPLLPGATWKASVPLHDVAPALALKAEVTLVPLLTDAAGSTAPLRAVNGAGHTVAVPWTLLLTLVVLGGLAAAVVLRRRRIGAPRRVGGAVA